MGDILAIIGFLGFIGCFIWLIVLMIKKQKKKYSVIGILTSAILFIVGASIMPLKPVSVSVKQESSAVIVSSSKITVPVSSEKSPTSKTYSNSEIVSEKNDSTITKVEYDQIRSGMTYDEVKKIVGSDGNAYYESGDKGTDTYVVNYMWNGNNLFSTVSITCTGKIPKVISKSQGGLKSSRRPPIN